MKDLALLFVIPVAIAVFAAIAIHAPRFFANPKYDFIYSTCDDYRCKDSYHVDANGRIVKEENAQSNSRYYNAPRTLHYYNADTDSTSSITLEEAHRYMLNTSSRSPDGYTLVRESTGRSFLFWGDYDESWYLKNGAKKKKVALSNTDYYYSKTNKSVRV